MVLENDTNALLYNIFAFLLQMMASGEFVSEWFYPYLNEMFEKWGAVK